MGQALHELRSRAHIARMLEQRLQHRKLRWREWHCVIRNGHGAVLDVERYRAVLNLMRGSVVDMHTISLNRHWLKRIPQPGNIAARGNAPL
jgi:hypothetical protein